MPSRLWKAGQGATNRYGIVVLLLCISYVASASMEGTVGLTAVLLLQLFTLWLTFSASESPHAQRIARLSCLALGLLAVTSTAFGIALEASDSILRWIALISVLLYLIAPMVILRMRLTTRQRRSKYWMFSANRGLEGCTTCGVRAVNSTHVASVSSPGVRARRP